MTFRPSPVTSSQRGSGGGRKRGGELGPSWTFPGAPSVGSPRPHHPLGQPELPGTHGAAADKLRNCQCGPHGSLPLILSPESCTGKDLRLCFLNGAEAIQRAGSDPQTLPGRPEPRGLVPGSDGDAALAHLVLEKAPHRGAWGVCESRHPLWRGGESSSLGGVPRATRTDEDMPDCMACDKDTYDLSKLLF